MLYYNAAQSNLVPVLQSLKKLGTQDSSQR